MKRHVCHSWLCAARGLAAACALAAPAIAAFADTDAHDAAGRERFRAAYAAAAVGIGADADDDEALRAYVLYPYLRAARIERALARAQSEWSESDAAAEAFLANAGNAPVAQALRRAWLTSLARRTSWQSFLDHYDAAAATPVLQCQQLNARLVLGEAAGLAAAVRASWLTGYRLPSECEPAFQWLRAEGGLTDELVAERAALLLDNGQAAFARIIAARLPSEVAAPLLERADFIEKPARMLDALIRDTSRDVPVPVVLEAWSRLARNTPDAALARYAAVRARVPAGEGEQGLALPLAKGLAWDRRPEALDFFARVPADALDSVGREWWARAAMWSGDWDEVSAAIATMSPKEQADWPWLYWAARAAEQRGDKDAARTLFTAALAGDNYYSAMAAARLGERVVPRLEPIPLDDAAVESIAAADAFLRVRELVLLGLRELATNEWHYGYALLPEPQRLQAIHLAARWGIYDVAVATATSQGRFNDYTLLYPRPHADEVAAAVKLTDVEPDLLYGVLRQESLFRPDAASAAGALGIAQLTPATAQRDGAPLEAAGAEARGLVRSGREHHARRGASRGASRAVRRGAARRARRLQRRRGGCRALAPPRAVDSDVWIENIPYNETRAYVRRVLWHSLVYRWLETGQPQSTRDWLTEIASTADAG